MLDKQLELGLMSTERMSEDWIAILYRETKTVTPMITGRVS